MAFFGGPIGLAITAVVGGLYLLSNANRAAAKAADELYDSYFSVADTLTETTRLTKNQTAEKIREVQAQQAKIKSNLNEAKSELVLQEVLKQKNRTGAGRRAGSPAARDAASNIEDLKQKIEELSVAGDQAVIDLKNLMDGVFSGKKGTSGFESVSKQITEYIQSLKNERDVLLTDMSEREKLNAVLKLEKIARAHNTTATEAQKNAVRALVDEIQGLKSADAVKETTLQTEATQRLADATLKGANAVREANIQNEIAQRLRDGGIASGSSAAKAIEDSIRAARQADDNLDNSKSLKAQQDKLDMLNKELGLVGLAKAEYASRLAVIEKENELKARGIDLSSAEAQKQIEIAGVIGRKQYELDKTKDVYKDLKDAIDGWGKQTAKTFADMITTGESSFKDLSNAFLNEVIQMILYANLLKPVFDSIKSASGTGGALGLAGSLITGSFAKGGAFSYGAEITAFAKGGVVDRPTLFPMAKGAGLMGEAGPEAVMPLMRGPNGELGVRASGGGSVQNNSFEVRVNVEGGSKGAEADEDLARRIGVAVDGKLRSLVGSELRNAMRPGGLFSQAA